MDQSSTKVTQLECNLDDVTGEIIGDATEALGRAGALDIWTVGIGMKKSRPGVTLCVLCEDDRVDEFARLIIQLTGSFGVRYRRWDRVVLDRRHETVDTVYGPIRVKIGSIDRKVMAIKCEYEDVKAAAQKHDVTVREVTEVGRAAAQRFVTDMKGGDA